LRVRRTVGIGKEGIRFGASLTGVRPAVQRATADVRRPGACALLCLEKRRSRRGGAGGPKEAGGVGGR
jgi:hypothetical protein